MSPIEYSTTARHFWPRQLASLGERSGQWLVCGNRFGMLSFLAFLCLGPGGDAEHWVPGPVPAAADVRESERVRLLARREPIRGRDESRRDLVSLLQEVSQLVINVVNKTIDASAYFGPRGGSQFEG